MPPNDFHRRRRQMRNAEPKELTADEAYEQGVEEMTEDPVIYVDPDAIRHRSHPKVRRLNHSEEQGFRRDVNRQVSGATDAIQDRIEEGIGRETSIGSLADEFKKSGPAALAHVEIDGQDYGVAIRPKHDLDTKEELVGRFVQHLDENTIDKIIFNMPGTDQDWMHIVGNHEGEHLNRPEYMAINPLNTLIEERRADDSAIAMAEARGQHDLAVAYKDLRHFTAHLDLKHATGAVLNSNDPITLRHMNVAKSYRKYMNEGVEDNFNFSTYTGEEFSADQLLLDDPDAYFSAVDVEIEWKARSALVDYNSDPTSFEAREQIISLQIRMDYTKNFEEAWRRRVLGEDVPEHEPFQLFSQEVEDAFLEEEVVRSRIVPLRKVHEYNITESYHPKVAFENFDWDSYEGEATEAIDLRDEDMELFYTTEYAYLENQKEQALADHGANPSYETLGRLVELEHIMDDRYDVMNIERLEAYGEGAPQVEIPDFVTDEMDYSYYKERLDRLKQQDVEVGNSVSSNFSGEDATYSGDASLLSEISDKGVSINPDLIVADQQENIDNTGQTHTNDMTV